MVSPAQPVFARTCASSLDSGKPKVIGDAVCSASHHGILSQRCDFPLQARANLSELVEQVNAGAEKIITKDGESYVALIDAQRLDYYHRLEHERIHLLLIDDARRGLEDIVAGRTQDADSAIARLQAAKSKANKEPPKRG
jgi:prevent-host-death family protein